MKIKYKFVYTGSFVQGKGIETIIALANHFKEFKFNVFGNLDTISSQNLNKCKSLKNLILNDYQSYFSICKILLKSEYLLLPYEKKISELIKNLDESKYISPLKMFEYLATKKIIFASYNKTYNHILKNNYNSLLINSDKIKTWIKTINMVIKNQKKFEYLKKNAYETSKKYTWKKRCGLILKFI